MNAVVAIGGAALLKVADAYRALLPSAVWILGLKTPRDVRDPLLRSLESLVEPLMEPYFAAVAQAQVAAMSAQLTALLLPGDTDPNPAANGLSATLWKEVAATLALVQMLDGADAIQPIDLVLNDDSSALARTAVAWARAHGLPSVTIPARVPLHRPRKPVDDRTIVVGERGRQVYRAVDVADSLLINVSPPRTAYAARADERATRRTDAKAVLTRALGWLESDIVVVFEPARTTRDSALEPVDAYPASLAAIFSALIVARASVPTLRLAVVGPPSLNGAMIAGQAAASAGVAAADFAYSESDYDVWIAAADIAVSIDSMQSMEASGAGVPAINLWRSANWYRGSSFASEDGVLDVPPHVLGATLVALANNKDVRTQLSSIGGDRITSDAAVGVQSAAAIARELVQLRHTASKPKIDVRLYDNLRHSATTATGKPKPDILIYAPPYWHGSAGHRALYRLCHLINLVGGNASIYPGTHLHPSWNTPRRNTELTDRTVVVYPEIYNQALSAKRVVRWCLNKPGLLGGPSCYGADEMVFYYHQAYRAAAQAATAELLTDERELQIAVTEPELFYNDVSRPRLYDCVFVYKGQALFDRVQPREIRDAYMIHSGWPASRTETAALLRGCRRLYSFDGNSAIVTEAIICGADVFMVRDDGFLQFCGSEGWNVEDYARQYYDPSPAERFLRLVDERWG